MVAIADVDALVKKDSPIDQHARINTTSVYTSARIFPMLPEKLSTDFTSLNPGEDRLAVVTSMDVKPDGTIAQSTADRARACTTTRSSRTTRCRSGSTARAPLPKAAEAAKLDDQIRTQDSVAQQLRARRREQRRARVPDLPAEAQFDPKDEHVTAIRQQVQNRARQLIEEFMIATNGVTARVPRGQAARRASAASSSRPSSGRASSRWRPSTARSCRSSPTRSRSKHFLAKQRKLDPLRFPDLSPRDHQADGLGRIRRRDSGRAEDRPLRPGGARLHAQTAPNRRYPDLVTQRLLKATLADEARPTRTPSSRTSPRTAPTQEDDANKVERRMRKSEAAMLLQGMVGRVFDGVVTGLGEGQHLGARVRPAGRRAAAHAAAAARGRQGAREAGVDERRAGVHRLRSCDRGRDAPS